MEKMYCFECNKDVMGEVKLKKQSILFTVEE